VQSLVIDRFGITISAEDLSSFKGTMRTPKHILNFLMSLFQEKIHHDLLKEGTGQRVRVFTTAFYNALTGNQLLSSRIFYEEASKFTFENIGNPSDHS
jgi:Ulp1 family protease